MKQKESLLKEAVKKQAPDLVWWYNIPTQVGLGGQTPPFDSIACVNGRLVAIEFKWDTMVAKPGQIVQLQRVAEAYGLAIMISGNSRNSHLQIKWFKKGGECDIQEVEGPVSAWGHILQLLGNMRKVG